MTNFCFTILFGFLILPLLPLLIANEQYIIGVIIYECLFLFGFIFYFTCFFYHLFKSYKYENGIIRYGNKYLNCNNITKTKIQVLQNKNNNKTVQLSNFNNNIQIISGYYNLLILCYLLKKNNAIDYDDEIFCADDAYLGESSKYFEEKIKNARVYNTDSNSEIVYIDIANFDYGIECLAIDRKDLFTEEEYSDYYLCQFSENTIDSIVQSLECGTFERDFLLLCSNKNIQNEDEYYFKVSFNS